MQHKIKLFTPVVVGLMALSIVQLILAYFFDRTLFLISGALSLLVFAVVLVMLRVLYKRTQRILQEIAASIQQTTSADMTSFPMPVVTLYGREIVWYNELCAARVFGGKDMRGTDISTVFPGLDFSHDSPAQGYDVTWGGRQYTAYATAIAGHSEPASAVYLVDNTELKHLAREYHESKPSVAILMVDNYEELVQDYKDSERAQLMGEIEQAIESYCADNHGFVTKISRDKFMAVIEERGFRDILAAKFDLLDRVRSMKGSGRMAATLSIGVGRDAGSMYESEQMARQALDMCLGRGGDQAAIRTQNGYEFYGGMSKAIEKRTKVKTRIIASALSELIESSSNVLIMGHRFADLDCLGSAVGMLKAIKTMGKQGAIAIDPEKNLVQPLLQKLLMSGEYGPGDFVEPEKALEQVGENTLLIVLDTHVPQVLESEELYRVVRTVVVIDHHRKLVNHIDNAVIFYHEPYASSASEMVTELVQYFPKPPTLTRLEAEALMSGIMLDTKNFVLRTGVRTFEAAAWLRRLGADTVEVRKLFASSMTAYQQKASLVATAEIYRQCAIAASDYQFDGVKVVAPQAADELMTISGVEASFVIFVHEGVVNCSARSLGAINVQLIMERLGGGGHQTMAAAQFPGGNIEDVRKRLMESIDVYNSNRTQTPAS